MRRRLTPCRSCPQTTFINLGWLTFRSPMGDPNCLGIDRRQTVTLKYRLKCAVTGEVWGRWGGGAADSSPQLFPPYIPTPTHPCFGPRVAYKWGLLIRLEKGIAPSLGRCGGGGDPSLASAVALPFSSPPLPNPLPQRFELDTPPLGDVKGAHWKSASSL